MEREFIPYEQALALKELGFDEPCIQQYSYDGAIMFCVNDWGQPRLKTNKQSYSDSGGDCISAPTFSQAFRWFRKKYDLHPSFTRYKSSSINREPTIFTHLYEIQIIDENADKIFHVGDFNSLEEAELECLKKLIEIVKQK